MKRFLYYELIICLLAYALAIVLTSGYVLNTYPDSTDRLLSEAVNPLAIERYTWGLSLVVMHIVFWCDYFTTFEVNTPTK